VLKDRNLNKVQISYWQIFAKFSIGAPLHPSSCCIL